MFIIIHGSHRHGYCWEISNILCTQLNVYNIDTMLIDLSIAEVNCCCGSQVCQETECIYKHDDFSDDFKDKIIDADGIFIITPTYFNMPPAKLKNFIDRTNALLPIVESAQNHPFFGAYVCGEADDKSISCNLNILKEYADIMGWRNIEHLNITECLTDNSEFVCERVKAIADLIYMELQMGGE